MSTGNKLIDSALEAKNFTLALKLVEKKIQQQPSSSYNLACKCYILAISALKGDSKITTDEALKAGIELAGKTPSDPKTLELLDIAFKSLDYKPKDDLYESAIRKYQTTALAYEWFKKTVDQNDIIGMQKAGMSLSKGFKIETDNGKMIKLWAAATMYLVIECCNDSDRLANGKASLLTMLGLKIMESVESVSSAGLNAQELFVKVQLLLNKGDHAECLKELKQFLEKERDLELLLIYFSILKDNKMWKELCDACVNYLVNIQVDDWDTWKLAILAAEKIDKKEEIEEIINNYPVGRNSQLAKIEVISPSDSTRRRAALENYLDLYMHKLCCYLDIRSILKSDSSEEFNKTFSSENDIFELLGSQLEKKDINSVLSGNRKANENDLNVLVNYIKIKLCIEPDLLENVQFFNDCCKYHELTKHLQNKLADFDYFAGFEFILVSIQSYLTINKESIDTQTYMNLAILLENSLIKNKYEFHTQLWLAHCYLNTNMTAPLKRIFENLKIKNVQIDTLGAYFINHLSSRTRNDDLISTAVKFYHHNVANELPPMVMSCFENCTFSKLKGFIEFKLRVENSISHYEVVLETIQNCRLNKENAIDIINMEYLPFVKDAYNKIVLDGKDIDTKLHDNIDRKIMWACGNHSVNEDVRQLIDTEFSKVYDSKYIEILILRELIIYDQHGRVWNDYKERFLQLISNNNNLTSFSEIEISLLKTLAYLLTCDDSTSMPKVADAPTDPLSPSFNNYYFTIQDFERILTTITKQSRQKTYFGDKKIRSKLNDVHTAFKKLCREIPRDDLIIMTKNSLKNSKLEAQDWFTNNEFGKQFNIPIDIVNKYYKNFEQDTLKSIREI